MLGTEPKSRPLGAGELPPQKRAHTHSPPSPPEKGSSRMLFQRVASAGSLWQRGKYPKGLEALPLGSSHGGVDQAPSGKSPRFPLLHTAGHQSWAPQANCTPSITCLPETLVRGLYKMLRSKAMYVNRSVDSLKARASRPQQDEQEPQLFKQQRAEEEYCHRAQLHIRLQWALAGHRCQTGCWTRAWI